ncbi:glycosyl hydrolase [Nibricoccus aquaticus]|uniref:Glycosyl hydrolase n=1 Tax=Nibricoccus aquaticus TaxID=2576891 RepID=A0A290Q704_9BACT|nr:glycoside hydrolase family 43 protein [Nibricoccus aquaticus]ATC64465.1 glycosyl hydrolase [Nibricoccus aquaticus]
MKNTLVALAFALGLITAAASAETPKTAYLFTYFIGNGADGLHLAWSKDGLKWEALGDGKSYLTPTVGKSKLMRDPCAALGPDGAYHMVWTSGWWENNIGYASTKDFITWTPQREIPVMGHEPAVRNTWAPELIWDKKREQFLIFWASTIPGKFPETAGASEDDLNHRMYATTTKDWQAFSPTKLWYDPGFSVIDATVISEGDSYRLIVKDETKTPVKKHLRHASATDVEGPWSPLSAPFTRDWVEGPTVLKTGDAWIVFFDVYKEKHYGALRTRDWKTFEDITAHISLPKGIRHGTVIEVPYALIERLLQN